MKFEFINGNEFDLLAALEWIDDNILCHIKTEPMSWIKYCGDGNKKYDEWIDFCPACAEQKIKEEVLSGNYSDGELKVISDSSIEDDGNNRCSACDVILECSSVGTWIEQEIDHCQQYEVDEDALYEFYNARDSKYFEDNRNEIKEIIKNFFKSGQYKGLLHNYNKE